MYVLVCLGLTDNIPYMQGECQQRVLRGIILPGDATYWQARGKKGYFFV